MALLSRDMRGLVRGFLPLIFLLGLLFLMVLLPMLRHRDRDRVWGGGGRGSRVGGEEEDVKEWEEQYQDPPLEWDYTRPRGAVLILGETSTPSSVLYYSVRYPTFPLSAPIIQFPLPNRLFFFFGPLRPNAKESFSG